MVGDVTFEARPYQIQARDAFYAYEGSKGAMLVMATGTGKTATAHSIVVDYLRRGERVLWLAHRKELVTQPLETLQRFWPELAEKAGLVWASHNQPSAQVVYASKDSIRNPKRLAAVLEAGAFGLVVADECHRSVSPTWTRVLDAVRSEGTRYLGLTATPDRDDTSQLSERWEIVYSYGILDALHEGFLLPPHASVQRIPDLNLDQVKSTRRDYVDHDLERELLRAHVVEHTVNALAAVHQADELPFRTRSAFINPADGGGVIVFTATVHQAKLTADALVEAGWSAAAVSGETPDKQRRKLLDDFGSGELKVLCNAAVLTEGTDLPRANCLVLARPTKSWSLFVQMVGRALRLFGEQERALIIDLVGATRSHSIIAAPVLVDGIDCEHSDDGKHHYLPMDTGEGRCAHCGDIIRCYARGGRHRYKDGRCKCGALQCEQAPDLQHHWVSIEAGKRSCICCSMEIPDPLHGIVNRRVQTREPVRWVRLDRIRITEVWMAHLDKHGVLFNLKGQDGWVPMWWTMTSGLVRLSNAPVSPELSRALTDDVARRAKKVSGRYGGVSSEKMARMAVRDAESIFYRERAWQR